MKVVEAITSNATTLGLIGSVFLLWTSLSLFSVLESAFNIVYQPPRIVPSSGASSSRPCSWEPRS